MEELLRGGFMGWGVFIPCLATACPWDELHGGAFPPAEGKGCPANCSSWEPKCGSVALPGELIKRINPSDAQLRWGSCGRIYEVIKNILMENTNCL